MTLDYRTRSIGLLCLVAGLAGGVSIMQVNEFFDSLPGKFGNRKPDPIELRLVTVPKLIGGRSKPSIMPAIVEITNRTNLVVAIPKHPAYQFVLLVPRDNQIRRTRLSKVPPLIGATDFVILKPKERLRIKVPAKFQGNKIHRGQYQVFAQILKVPEPGMSDASWSKLEKRLKSANAVLWSVPQLRSDIRRVVL
ncbi:MAG: hypothetical protein JST40_11535 [Armatimonadetes bacterium]|nr:hypothetical protein [Armatimonadota bacterium]